MPPTPKSNKLRNKQKTRNVMGGLNIFDIESIVKQPHLP